LGLIFLKYISDAFEELYTRLKAEEAAGADPEDKDEYRAENVFFSDSARKNQTPPKILSLSMRQSHPKLSGVSYS